MKVIEVFAIGPWQEEKQQFLDDRDASTFGLDVATIRHTRFGLEPSCYSDDWQQFPPLNLERRIPQNLFGIKSALNLVRIETDSPASEEHRPPASVQKNKFNNKHLEKNCAN